MIVRISSNNNCQQIKKILKRQILRNVYHWMDSNVSSFPHCFGLDLLFPWAFTHLDDDRIMNGSCLSVDLSIGELSSQICHYEVDPGWRWSLGCDLEGYVLVPNSSLLSVSWISWYKELSFTKLFLPFFFLPWSQLTRHRVRPLKLGAKIHLSFLELNIQSTFVSAKTKWPIQPLLLRLPASLLQRHPLYSRITESQMLKINSTVQADKEACLMIKFNEDGCVRNYLGMWM